TDTKSVKAASRSAYDDLLAAGYEIHEYQPTMMHVKAVVIDRRWSLVGSANFDNRSFELNDEITIAVDDPALADALTSAFERDLKRSRRLTVEEWRKRSIFERAMELFWGLFGEVLSLRIVDGGLWIVDCGSAAAVGPSFSLGIDDRAEARSCVLASLVLLARPPARLLGDSTP